MVVSLLRTAKYWQVFWYRRRWWGSFPTRKFASKDDRRSGCSKNGAQNRPICASDYTRTHSIHQRWRSVRGVNTVSYTDVPSSREETDICGRAQPMKLSCIAIEVLSWEKTMEGESSKEKIHCVGQTSQGIWFLKRVHNRPRIIFTLSDAHKISEFLKKPAALAFICFQIFWKSSWLPFRSRFFRSHYPRVPFSVMCICRFAHTWFL